MQGTESAQNSKFFTFSNVLQHARMKANGSELVGFATGNARPVGLRLIEMTKVA